MKKWVLLAVSTGVSLLVAELALRNFAVFDPFPEIAVGERENRRSRHSVVDEAIGWKLRPHDEFGRSKRGTTRIRYRANGQGFRSEREFDAGERRRKIVLAGDSFVMGVGVKYAETFGALVEAELGDSVVYNLGMPGFGVDQIWQTVRHYGLPLKPDLVIVGLVDADFKRSETAYRMHEGRNKPAFRLDGGELVRKTPEDRPNAAVRWLENHSRLWMGMKLVSRRIGYSVPFGRWWYLNRAILEAIQADCREAGTPVLFVYIPTVAWRSFPTLDSYMAETGAEYVSLRSGGAGPDGLYLERDGHLNPEGHRYTAGLLTDWIRRNRRVMGGWD